MAYNPFDDVILNDPAYMANGGPLQLPRPQIGIEFPQATQQQEQEQPRAQLSVRPQDRIDYSQQKDQFRPVSTAIARFYKLLTPEQETLDQIERDQQLRSLATAQAFTGTEFEEFAGDFDLPGYIVQNSKAKELLKNVGYQPEGFVEGISRVGKFFYGNQRKAFEKMRDGEQLTSEDRISIALAPLDSLDFLFPPLILKKLAGLGLKNVNAVLKSTADLPEVKQIQKFFGGEPLPLIQDAAKGPPGMVTEPRIALAPADEGTAAAKKTLAPETKAKRDAAFREKRLQTVEKIREGAKNFETKDEAIKASGLSKPQYNKILREEGITTEDLGLKVGKRGTPDTSAEKKKVLDNFLAANPDKQFTRSELAEATGLPKSYVKDKRIYQTDAPNLVTLASKQAEDFDDRIKGMNDLLEDLRIGKTKDGKVLDKNMGPEYYKSLGYNIDPKIKKNYLEFPQSGQQQTLSVNKKDLSTIIGKKSGDATERIDDLSNYLNVNGYKAAATEYAAKRILLRDYYRGISQQGKDEFDRLIMDPEGFGFPPKLIMKNGLPEKNPLLGTAAGVQQQKQAMNNLLGAIAEISGGPKNIKAIQSLQEQKKILNDYADKSFFNLLNNNKLLQKRFLDEANRVSKTKYDRWEDAFPAFKNRFHGQLSHVVSSKHLGTPKDPFKKAPKLEGKKGFAGLMRINFDNHNVSLQPRLENVIMRNVKKITKNLNDEKALNDIANADVMLKERGMLTYMRFTDKEMSEQTFKRLQNFFGTAQVFKEGGRKTIMLGQPNDPSVSQLKSYLDNRFADYNRDPKTFKLSAAMPEGKQNFFEDVMMETGDNDYIYEGYLTPKSFVKGGPVRMAIGGDPLQNINQQQFMPDPAFEGEDFFQQAVDSGNLTAFNPTKLFKVFGKVDAVETPKKKIQTDTQVGPPGTTLPATQQMQPSDFAFKSFTLETIMDPNAPKAARPQDWQNFFKGKAAPEAELNDSGIMQYLSDFAQYYPNQKITQKQLVDFYETSPMGNISIKVKQDGTNVPADADFLNFLGKPKHKNAGNQPLDEAGQNYREVVVQSGPLPGEGKPFVASGHYSEENVLGFTRVADYKNVDGQTVAVIQELQTDMLTKVRKEQERLNALLKRIENIKERANQRLQLDDAYEQSMAQRALERINSEFPPATLEKLQQNLSAIKPFPNTAGKELIPTYAKELSDLQAQINKLADIDIQTPNPETLFSIANVETQQQKVLDNLLDLTRDSELERDLKGIKVPSSDESDSLTAFGQSSDSIDSVYGNFKDLELFPPIPFNKQPDYVDLLLKATIKDAQTKGINKVAIMPADKVNQRWGKNPTGPEGVKFNNLYGKVTVQQMKNIAKKYKGNVAIEKIVDNTKPSKALRFFNRDVDGGLKLNKEDVARRTTTESEEGLDEFYNEQIRRFVSGGGYRDKDVVLTREVAPGQFQDFFVRADDDTVNFVPLGEGDIINDALIVIEEFNPQLVDMVTLTLDSPQSKGPFFMFKKKDGGTIEKDSLVSITDIFGQYGR